MNAGMPLSGVCLSFGKRNAKARTASSNAVLGEHPYRRAYGGFRCVNANGVSTQRAHRRRCSTNDTRWNGFLNVWVTPEGARRDREEPASRACRRRTSTKPKTSTHIAYPPDRGWPCQFCRRLRDRRSRARRDGRGIGRRGVPLADEPTLPHLPHNLVTRAKRFPNRRRHCRPTSSVSQQRAQPGCSRTRPGSSSNQRMDFMIADNREGPIETALKMLTAPVWVPIYLAMWAAASWQRREQTARRSRRRPS